MPSGIFDADINFPQFTGEESSSQKIEKISNYLFMLLENLRYSYSHIGSENLDNELNGTISDMIQSVSDNKRALAQFITEVGDTYATASQLSQYQSDTSSAIASVTVTAAQTYATIESVAQYQTATNNSIAQITQTVNADSAKISLVVSTNGTNSTINAAGIVAAVNSSGSTVRISADHLDLVGVTTFLKPSDVAAGGQTVIDGGRITTGEVSSERFKRVAGSSFIDMASNTRISGILGIMNASTQVMAQQYVEGGVFRIQHTGKIFLYPEYNGSTGSGEAYISGAKIITSSNISQYVSSVAAVFG